MSAKSWPWDVLDLPRAPETTADVRRAYAKKLKTIDQAKDIAGFEALRTAYEAALVRVEQKVRKAAAKAATITVVEPLQQTDSPEPEADGAPAKASADGVALPDVPPADAPPPVQIQSAEDRLRLRLDLLSEKNILLSPSAQVQAMLDEPEFRSPELDPMLRHGLAQFIRSQLLWNHLNEPYLRHPGVTADLLKALDARFGWLSDYTAFRRDFWGDTHILEAMVDTAGIERFSKSYGVQIKDDNRQFRILLVFGFMILAPKIYDATKDSPDGSAPAILGALVGLAAVLIIVGGGLAYLYDFVRGKTSRRVAVAACLWAITGIPTLLIANGAVSAVPAVGWPFAIWAVGTCAIVLFLLGRWLWRHLEATGLRCARKGRKD